MSLPSVSVIVPTVKGREDHLKRCVDTYHRLAVGSYDLELIVVHDYPTCGAGWQAGMTSPSPRGQFIHLSCDDIEPRPGWFEPAREACDLSYVPAPQCYDPSGYPQSAPSPGQVAPDWTPVAMSALPFFTDVQWKRIGPLFTGHYYTDDFVSWRARRAGWDPVLRTGYAFTHHYAQVLRGTEGMNEPQRMEYDLPLYKEAQRMVECGEWDRPWPL